MNSLLKLTGALAAGHAALANRPEMGFEALLQVGGMDRDQADGPVLQEPKQQVCYIMKGIKPDGVGHMLFSMITVMGAHGLVNDDGLCYVYDTRPREFAFDHMAKGGHSWKESMDVMTGFYKEFVNHVTSGPQGCATPELLANRPTGFKPVNQMPLFLTDVCNLTKFTTWELDNLYYGSDFTAFLNRQLISKPGPFMQAVINNASTLAVLAAKHLPHVQNAPPLAVHMRMGDRAAFLGAITEGQKNMLQKPGFVSRFSPVRVYSDQMSADDTVKTYLPDEVVAHAEFCGRDCSTALQAVASMVAAEAFVGSMSDLSSTVALMRIGLGRKYTYMPSSWQWAHGFSESELNIYAVADHHQESCSDICADDQDDWCYWCGRHQTDQGLKWMSCCDAAAEYPAEHHCRGAAYNSSRGAQCVVGVGAMKSTGM